MKLGLCYMLTPTTLPLPLRNSFTGTVSWRATLSSCFWSAINLPPTEELTLPAQSDTVITRIYLEKTYAKRTTYMVCAGGTPPARRHDISRRPGTRRNQGNRQSAHDRLEPRSGGLSRMP